jgi:hypothetical protein
LTYVASGSIDEIADMDTRVLEASLPRSQWRQVGFSGAEVDFAWGEINPADFRTSKKFFNQPAKLKNFLGDGKKHITDKSRLYDTMDRLGLTEHIPYATTLAKLKRIDKGDVYFIKNSKACAQEDIYIVTSDADLAAVKAQVATPGAGHKKGTWIASQGVANPLLWRYHDTVSRDGITWMAGDYKFHLRVYLMVSVEMTPDGTESRVYVNDDWWRVLTAKEPYETEIWNPDGHLSGGSKTYDNFNWREGNVAEMHTGMDPVWIANANKSVVRALTDAGRAIAEYTVPYPESKSAYEIFGADVVLDQEGKAWIIEVNTHAGYAINRTPAIKSKVSNIMFDWQLRSVVLPHFGLAPRPDPLFILKK